MSFFFTDDVDDVWVVWVSSMKWDESGLVELQLRNMSRMSRISLRKVLKIFINTVYIAMYVFILL